MGHDSAKTIHLRETLVQLNVREEEQYQQASHPPSVQDSWLRLLRGKTQPTPHPTRNLEERYEQARTAGLNFAYS